MEKPSMRIEMITPDIAKDYLSRNTRNRALRKSHLDDLVRQMRAGQWALNGQSIIFDEEDALIDGQHRLNACAISGVSFLTYVVRGVSDARAFTTIDTGKPRGAHDMATYMGDLTATQAKDCVAIARLVYAYEQATDKGAFNGRSGTATKDPEFIAAFTLSLMPLLLECSNHAVSVRGFVEKSTAGACLYLFCKRSKEDAFQFFNMLSEGVFSSPYHPIKMLRDALMMREKVKKSPHDQRLETMAFFFKTWSAYRKGKEIKVLRWTREGANFERFPELA